MDPAVIARMDQAGAGLRDIAHIVAAMSEAFIKLGVAPDLAVGHAISLVGTMLLWAQHESDDDGG